MPEKKEFFGLKIAYFLIMKRTLKAAITSIFAAFIGFFLNGQSLKERIDEAKEVKVYFDFYPIHHNPNTLAPNPSTWGTDCPKFDQTTTFPTEYTDAINQVIDLLNKGFKTSAFNKGDIKTVPLLSGITPDKIESTMLQMLSESVPGWTMYDFEKLGEPLLIYILTSGAYNVENVSLPDRKVFIDYFTVQSDLVIYYLKSGKTGIRFLTYKNLSNEKSSPIHTTGCNNYDYFLKNFPAESLAESFKTSVFAQTNELIEKEMERYNKAMKRKK